MRDTFSLAQLDVRILILASNVKILFLTSRLPYPPFRGDKLKIWNLISQLSKNNEIYLTTFVQHQAELRWLPQVKEKCAAIQTVHKPTWKSVLSCIKAVPSTRPFQVAYFESKEMAQALRASIRRFEPDIIHTHLIRLAPYTLGMDKIPRVLDMTDAVALYLARFRDAQKNLLRRRVIDVEYKRVTGFESVVKQYEKCLVCSATDQKFLQERNPGANIDVLANGIDLETFAGDKSVQVDSNRIIFTGNLGYYPNADAVSHFVRTILPIIRKKRPDVKFYIVGQNPPSSIRNLACDHVVVTGFVDDIQREYLKSSVAVSPVRFGAGTLNKVLEPLALGVPVVATSVGTQDLQLVDGKDIFIADDPERFAGAVCRILENRDLRDRIGKSAQERVRTTWSWENIAHRLQEIYRDLHERRTH